MDFNVYLFLCTLEEVCAIQGPLFLNNEIVCPTYKCQLSSADIQRVGEGIHHVKRTLQDLSQWVLGIEKSVDLQSNVVYCKQ